MKKFINDNNYDSYIIKPINGAGSKNIKIVAKSEIDENFKKNTILQPYFENSIIYNYDVVAQNGKNYRRNVFKRWRN